MIERYARRMDFVLVRRLPPETVDAHGNPIEASDVQKNRKAKVIAVGPDVPDLQPDEVVYLKKYGGERVGTDDDGTHLLLLRQSEVFAKVELVTD